MADQSNNLPSGGTERVETSDDDYSGMADYWEPEEETDNSNPSQAETDVGEEAAVEEVTEVTDEAPETAEEPAETEAPLDAVVTLADGTKAKVADLAQGYLRQQDYSRKTQEIANTRKDLSEKVQSLERTVQVFVDHLTGLVPEPPPPSLALTNPSQYTAQKAQYEAALSEVQKLVEIGQKPKELAGSLSKEDHAALIAEENRKLSERFPETASQQGRQKFFNDVAEVASDLGFSMDELGQITDHRLFALAHYARKGMAAEQAQKVAAQKVAKAPPVAPRKPGQTGKPNGNAEAMKRLNRSGSIKDALKVDWD